MIERDSKQMITNIIRLDNGSQPAVIFSKPPEFATELHCEIEAVSEDQSDASSRISVEKDQGIAEPINLTEDRVETKILPVVAQKISSVVNISSEKKLQLHIL